MSPIIGTKGSDHLVGSPDKADTIIGDPFSGGLGGAADNGRLLSSGTGGNDLIEGLGGGNHVTGAVDVLYGDAFQITGTGHGGNDTLVAGPDISNLRGDANLIGGHGVGGRDVLVGGAGIDNLDGDATTMSEHARGAHDIVSGGAGGDQLAGDAFFMRDQAHGGNDLIDGGPGDDALAGDAFGRDPDTVGGRDRFVFAPGSGHDDIADFESGKDHFDVHRYHLPGRALGLDTNHDGHVDVQDAFASINENGTFVIDLGAARGGQAGVDTVAFENLTSLTDTDLIA